MYPIQTPTVRREEPPEAGAVAVAEDERHPILSEVGWFYEVYVACPGTEYNSSADIHSGNRSGTTIQYYPFSVEVSTGFDSAAFHSNFAIHLYTTYRPAEYDGGFLPG